MIQADAAGIVPVSPGDQVQSPFDLFVIFIGANIVATTFQVGASLSASFGLPALMGLIVVGSVAGAALVAVLAPLGSWRAPRSASAAPGWSRSFSTSRTSRGSRSTT